MGNQASGTRGGRKQRCPGSAQSLGMRAQVSSGALLHSPSLTLGRRGLQEQAVPPGAPCTCLGWLMSRLHLSFCYQCRGIIPECEGLKVCTSTPGSAPVPDSYHALTHTPTGPADAEGCGPGQCCPPPHPPVPLSPCLPRTPVSLSCSGPRLSMMMSFFRSSSIVDL